LIQILRLVIVTFACLGLGLFLGREILLGLKTGKIAYTASRIYCDRSKSPLSFWLLVVLFTIFGCLAIAAWVHVGLSLLEQTF
jgi:hypothetical protein